MSAGSRNWGSRGSVLPPRLQLGPSLQALFFKFSKIFYISAHPNSTKSPLLCPCTIVAATAPLSKPTARRLRLACRATKSAIDERITTLRVPKEALDELRIEGNTLTAGIASLKIYEPDLPSVHNISKAFEMAKLNRKTLETFDICLYEGYDVNKTAAQRALATLGDASWPSLRSLSLSAFPGILGTPRFTTAMPALTELRLTGTFREENTLGAADTAALTADPRFTENVEILELGPCDASEYAEEFYDHLGALLESAKRLRHLSLSFEGCDDADLEFLNEATLPNLEVLELLGLSETLLDPITYIPRPRLRALTVGGQECGGGCPSGLVRLITAGAAALSGLEHLKFEWIWNDMAFLREIKLNLITSLSVSGSINEAHMANIGAAAARLPALESLEIVSCSVMPRTSAAAMTNLLSGAPLPHLRRLKTDWNDSVASAKALAGAADKVPGLEEIIMGRGQVGVGGFTALAQAGRRGAWPDLKLFQVSAGSVIYTVERNRCIRIVQKVWPGLQVVFAREE